MKRLDISTDNNFTVHAIIGREITQTPLIGLGTGSDTTGFPGLLASLDMKALIAHGCPSKTDPVEAATHCKVDNLINADPTKPFDEVHLGPQEADCPTIAPNGVLFVPDETNGGPHFYSFDHDNWNAPTNLHRLSFFDYFVTESGVGGNLNVCMVNIGADGSLNRDFTFPAVAVAGEQRNPAGSSCISFNRADWPEPRGFGAGPAKPHYGIFAGRLGGGCDPACTDGQSCVNGTCVCPAGTTDCSGTCINTQDSDSANCGACGTQCLPGATCEAGVCTCPDPEPGVCVQDGGCCNPGPNPCCTGLQCTGVGDFKTCQHHGG